MTDPRALIDDLVAVRLSRGISQATIARRMGIGKSAVCNLERDPGRDPKLSTLTRYADALGVTINIHNPRATQPKTVAEQVESPACMEA